MFSPGDLTWVHPLFPYYFSGGFPLSTALTYSFSSSIGKVYSYYGDTGTVLAAYTNSCEIVNVMADVRPLSIGR